MSRPVARAGRALAVPVLAAAMLGLSTSAQAMSAAAPPATTAAASDGGAQAPAEVAPRTTLSVIEHQVMCVTCKIPLPEAQSEQADRERALIKRLIGQGRTEAQIKRTLVAEYGPAVLSLPSSQGFGLAVYLVPPMVALAALVLLMFALPRWRRRGRRDEGAWGAGRHATLSPSEAARLDSDLARFEP